MTPEKLEMLRLLDQKIKTVKTSLTNITNKTRPDPRAKVIHPWSLLEKDSNHQAVVQFKGGISDQVEQLAIQVPHRLMVNWVRDLENYYESELRLLEEEFLRL